MSHNAHEFSDHQITDLMRRIKVQRLGIPAELSRPLIEALKSCSCADCVAARVRLGENKYGTDIVKPAVLPQSATFSLPEANAITNSLVELTDRNRNLGFELADSALSHAGLLCWLMGQAFHAQMIDYPVSLQHTVSQRHAALRDAIECRRLLLWLHRELDELSPNTRIRVLMFDGDLPESEVGVVFGEAVRQCLKAVAVRLVERCK